MTLDEAKQLKPEQIREKIAPPRRMFKKGDIVWYRNTFFHVLNDSDGVSVYIAECGADVNPLNECLVVSPDNIQLVSADRKGAV